MSLKINEVGNRYERLKVLRGVGSNKWGESIWECKCDCGEIIIATGSKLRGGRTKSCSCLRNEKSGERGRAQLKGNKYTWNGGRFKTREGYCRVVLKGHPRADVRGYVLEHLLVMENHIGRPVERDETVHHKNGNKSDNRIENLGLRVGNHGRGGDIDHVVKYAIKILKRYAPETLCKSCHKKEGV